MSTKIYYKENLIQVYFTNPITKEKIEKSFVFKNKKKAIELANQLDFDFYSKNKGFLKRGISVETKNKRFRLFVRLSIEDKKDRPKIIFSSKILSEVENARSQVLKTLIEF